MTRLSISLLGSFRVILDGKPIAEFESDKVRALLAYLAVESDRSHRRETLAGLLWPEWPERSARQNLSQALFNLRRAIGDEEGGPSFLIVTQHTVQFNRSSSHWLDVRTFTALLAACEKHRHRRLEACSQCIKRLQRAVVLYRGNFLEGFSLSDSASFEEWSLLERERLHRVVMEALSRLALCHEQRGEYEKALQHVWRQVELEPWREEAHQQLMRVLAISGRRSEALSQYETCRRLLAKELGVEPAMDTVSLYQKIRNGELEVPVSIIDQPPEHPFPLPASLDEQEAIEVERRVFVGREAELRQLQSAFDGTVSGKGTLLMVVGEPGIGKTALCEQLSTYVSLRGGRTLVGHCYEEGSLSLPYLAFVEALRSYVLSREVDELRKELGTGAADVARIVSEVRERLQVELRPPSYPEEDRYLLMQAVTDFLRNAATVQPLLIVLEDLQDADKGTLEMLAHVARNLTGARLLIVGTYRDIEVDRAHPLSAALAELRRVSTLGRVLLRGLSADEVQGMLASITGQDVPWGLAEAVHRQTEGNPLFVHEVVRYLVEEGLISWEGGRWRATGKVPLAMSIPEGLRDVIGRRLSRLSPECNRLLSISAVIGREFRLNVLQRVAGATEDELFAALEEAKGAAVVEERSAVAGVVTYRFAHAFFRQTLYEEIIAPRRIRLHQQVARALENQYAARLEEHATELAEHFSQSSDPTDLGKAVGYGEMAARRATTVYAYGEAVRLLEQALQVHEVLEPEDKGKRCDLLLALGDALNLAGEPRRVLDVEAPEAFYLAEAIDDTRRASRVCWLAMSALTYYGFGPAWGTSEAAQWAESADRYAESDTVERAWADMGLGNVKYTTGNPEEGVTLLSRALDLTRRLGDPDTFWWVAAFWLYRASAPQHVEERLHLAEELAEGSRAGVSIRTLSLALSAMGNTFLECGQRRRTEEVWGELQDRAERIGQANLLLLSMFFDAILAALNGHLEEAVEMSQRITSLGEELGLSEYASVLVRRVGLRPRLHLGIADDALQRALQVSAFPHTKLFFLAHLGRDAEVAQMLEQLVMARPGIGSNDDETAAWLDILLLEAAVLVGHRQAAELLLRRLADSGLHTTGQRFATCTARHLGAAAALLDRPEEARAHYQEALEVARDMRFRPEFALTRLQLAELLLEHYPEERAEALEHLDFAIAEFRDMKMQPALERALRHKDILKA